MPSSSAPARDTLQYDWDAHKLGFTHDALWTTLFDHFNKRPVVIQSDDAFHHDVVELSKEATGREHFYDLLEKRRQLRLSEIKDIFEATIHAIHPDTFGDAERPFRELLGACQSRSIDKFASFLAAFVPQQYWDQRERRLRDKDQRYSSQHVPTVVSSQATLTATPPNLTAAKTMMTPHLSHNGVDGSEFCNTVEGSAPIFRPPQKTCSNPSPIPVNSPTQDLLLPPAELGNLERKAESSEEQKQQYDQQRAYRNANDSEATISPATLPRSSNLPSPIPSGDKRKQEAPCPRGNLKRSRVLDTDTPSKRNRHYRIMASSIIDPFRYSYRQTSMLICVLLIRSDHNYRLLDDSRPLFDVLKRGPNEFDPKYTQQSTATFLQNLKPDLPASSEELHQHLIYILSKVKGMSTGQECERGLKLPELDWQENMILVGMSLGISISCWCLEEIWPSDDSVQSICDHLSGTALFGGDVTPEQLTPALDSLEILFREELDEDKDHCHSGRSRSFNLARVSRRRSMARVGSVTTADE